MNIWTMEEKLAKTIQEAHGKISWPNALIVARFYIDEKLVTADMRCNGRYTVKHGGFLDPVVITRAFDRATSYTKTLPE